MLFRSEYMPALLHHLREDGPPPAVEGAPEIWGVGYFADDRGLIVRKPTSILDERSAYGVAKDLRSRIVLACARRERVQLDAPPFRFRRWLFGYAGNVDVLGRLQAQVAPRMPDFVRDVLGDEHGGRFAHAMFLTELHRAGVLEDPLATSSQLAATLGRTVESLDRLAPEAGCPALEAAFVASNGRSLIVACAGRPLVRREIRGLEGLPDGPVDETLNDFKRVAEGLKRFRAQVVTLDGSPAAGVDGQTLPDRSVTIIDGNLEVSTEALA